MVFDFLEDTHDSAALLKLDWDKCVLNIQTVVFGSDTVKDFTLNL